MVCFSIIHNYLNSSGANSFRHHAPSVNSWARFVIDVVDTGSFQTIAEFFGSFGMFFRTDTREKYVDVIIECLAVFDSVISCVYILQIDIACSTEATDISKLVEVIQREGIKSEETTGKSALRLSRSVNVRKLDSMCGMISCIKMAGNWAPNFALASARLFAAT